MKLLRKKRSNIIPNILIAVVVTVVVNFSPLLSLIFNSNEASFSHRPSSAVTQYEGVMTLSHDGYGYLTEAHVRGSDRVIDSIYVSGRLVRMFALKSGDVLRCTATPPTYEGGNLRVGEILLSNNAAPETVMNDALDIAVQFLYFFFLAWLMLTIMTWQRRGAYRWNYLRRVFMVFIIAFGFYFITPMMNWRTGDFELLLSRSGSHLVNWLIILKFTVVVVAIVLYGRIYLLLTQKQDIQLENEQLRNENLQTRYNMLVGQINPHFFFNSLNSLSMLVREQSNEKALEYVDQLSYTFRYIIQNGKNTLTTLGEEIDFARAYGELFKVRYADKLFIDINIEPEMADWLLPALSLQPLIGNAVKHNTITKRKPFTISIRTEGTMLVVENRKSPKLEQEPSTGIGLKNLKSRWQLITGQKIDIIDGEEFFTVRMPLQKPE